MIVKQRMRFGGFRLMLETFSFTIFDYFEPSYFFSDLQHSHFYLFLIYYFFSFYGCTHSIWKIPGQGSNWSWSCQPIIATATPDPSHVCDLHHSSYQCRILNPPSKVRDQTRVLMDTSRILKPLSHNEYSAFSF